MALPAQWVPRERQVEMKRQQVPNVIAIVFKRQPEALKNFFWGGTD